LARNRLLMRVDNSTGKGTSDTDKLSSKVHRVHMELGKLFNSLRIKPSSLKVLQSV
jgi:stress response protein SCP2